MRWFSADGIPVTTFDDSGRVNPYPLMRVSAVDNQSGRVLATVDTVTPVSGEANCRLCHTNNDPANGGVGGYTATAQGVSLDYKDASGNLVNFGNTATAMDDPKYGEVPLAVSVEYAQDLNVLRYYDRAFGTATANNPNRGYRDDAGVLHDCTISRWKYRPAAGFSNSNGTPAGGAHLAQRRRKLPDLQGDARTARGLSVVPLHKGAGPDPDPTLRRRRAVRRWHTEWRHDQLSDWDGRR